MRALAVTRSLILATSIIALVSACKGKDDDDDDHSGAAVKAAEVGPGSDATDSRVPELGPDLSVVRTAKVSMADGLAKAKASGGLIEAKYELDDAGKLSLSIYPAGKGLTADAERNVFQELSGDPTTASFAGKLEAFEDRDHLVRSARDLTLLQLSKVTLEQAVTQSAAYGLVYWAIPTIKKGRAGYGVYTLGNAGARYDFIDGNGSSASSAAHLTELGATPGAGATDERTPELGEDLAVLATSKITMSAALESSEKAFGPTIEAKFEIGDDKKLSLSIYPTEKGLEVDAERNGFRELAGDPTASGWSPTLEVFKADDKEHQVRSSRDLTIVQTAGLSLRAAVSAAEKAVPGGIVYWAVPTIRETRSGYGVYVYGADKKAHYFFVS